MKGSVSFIQNKEITAISDMQSRKYVMQRHNIQSEDRMIECKHQLEMTFKLDIT